LKISLHKSCKGYFVLLIIFFHLTGNPLFAQQLNSGDENASVTDTSYVADYKDQLTARIFLLYQDASIAVNPESSEELIFRPNVSGRIGIAGFYKWFGLGLSLGNSILKRSTTTYGNTSVLDLRVNAYGRPVAAEVYFQDLKGFYIPNFKDPEGNFYKIPDMHVFALGFTGYYIYNYQRFSIRSAFIQNERQKKSAGSFILRPTFLYYKLSSDNGILPAQMISSYGISTTFNLRQGEFVSIGLAPGYTYSLILFKNFYLNAAVFPGVLWQHYNYESNLITNTGSNFTFTLSWRAALGYNTDRWYIGASIVSGFDKIPGWIGNSTFYYDIAQVRFWVGTRFSWFKKKK